MLTYYAVICLAVFFAALAGSRVAAGQEGQILSPRTQAAWVFAFISGAVLTVTSAFRYRVGTDFGGYERNYNIHYREWTWSDFRWNEEPGIRAITWLSIRIHDDALTMFILTALITVGLFMWTYAKYSTSFAMSVLLFVLTGPWTGSFNGVRQYLAAAIVFAGQQFIVERKLVKYALVVALASLFHISAMVLILLYFVPRRKLSFVSVFMLVGMALLASYGYELAATAISFIQGEEFTGTAYFTEPINPLRIAFAFVPFAAFYLFAKRERLSDRSYFYVNMTLIFGTLFLAAYGSAHLGRFAIYAQPFTALAVPAILQATGAKTRPILTYLLVGAYFLFWYIAVSVSPALNPFVWRSF